MIQLTIAAVILFVHVNLVPKLMFIRDSDPRLMHVFLFSDPHTTQLM